MSKKAYVLGITSVVIQDKRDLRLFRHYKHVSQKEKLIRKKFYHVFFYDYDKIDLNSVIDYVTKFAQYNKIDVSIIQSSTDGYHLVCPFIFIEEIVDNLIGQIEDELDDKVYPQIRQRDYDRYLTLRVSPKFSRKGRIIKDSPRFVMTIKGSDGLIKSPVSEGHIRFFGLPVFDDYDLVKTYPLFVHYSTRHRTSKG